MRFQPKDFNIFQSLQQHFELIRDALRLLRRCATGATEAADAYARIQQLERDGDVILRNAVRQLDHQLTDYPPREDTRRMFYQQDRILDAMEHLAGRLTAYRLGALPDGALRLVAIVEECAGVLTEATRAFGDARHFVAEIGKMADLENDADQQHIQAIQEAVEQDSDTRRFLMHLDVYGRLENIVNLFEDCIQAMEDAALKTLAGL